MAKKKQQKKLQELSLIDDFLMNQMVTHPVYGEAFCRSLLGIILHRPVRSLEIVSQKAVYGTATDRHGIRLDVYMRKESGEIHDLEPERKKSRRESLPKRARFYHSRLDAENFHSGSDYHALKDVYVIFISDFDPFGCGRMVYTVSNRCEELPAMPYDDGAKTLFLNTRGTPDETVGESLRELLAYMEHSDDSHAMCAELQSVHRMVEAVKQDREVGVAYMKSWEIERELKEEGRKQGHEDGLKEGLALGHENGRIDTLIELVADGILTVEQAAGRSGMETDDVRQKVKSICSKSLQ